MKRLLLVVLLIASFASRYSAATVFADCLGPNPTATPQPTYADKVLATASGHLLAYWKLDETGGSTAADASGNSRNGTYSGATLNSTTFADGVSPAPSFDGVNDNVNIYSASLASAFNNAQGSAMAWGKVRTSSVWTDATVREIFQAKTDGNNTVNLDKSSTSNVIRWIYTAGGTALTRSKTSYSSTSWFVMLVTWDKTGNQKISYLDGTQEGATQTGLGTWSGSLNSSTVTIGASTTAGASPWDGYISNVAIWDSVLSSSDASNLATVPSIAPTATLYPTCTPSPSPSPTITPSASPTLTLTPSPTLTPSMTLDLYTYITVIPPGGGPSDAQRVAIKHEVGSGQFMIALLLFAIFLIGLFDRILKARGR